MVALPASALLGDTPTRDYSRKLQLFNAFAKPEIRQVISSLNLKPGMRVLDAGCGTGEALEWLRDEVGPTGSVVGLDLSAAHVSAAQRAAPTIKVLQCDILNAPLEPATFDLIWCVNTINHLRDAKLGVVQLAGLLRSGGRIALAQSSLLPDMYFAWNSRLERVTNEAVRSYYRDRYRLGETDLAAVRALSGILRSAKLHHVAVRTVIIERTSPLDAETEVYLREAIFRDTWGGRLRPYLSPDDFVELSMLCDSQHAQYALRRPDFHFMQTFTLATGGV